MYKIQYTQYRNVRHCMKIIQQECLNSTDPPPQRCKVQSCYIHIHVHTDIRMELRGTISSPRLLSTDGGG